MESDGVKRKASASGLNHNAPARKTSRNANGEATPTQTSNDVVQTNPIPIAQALINVPVTTNTEAANLLQYGTNTMNHSFTDSGLLHLLYDNPDHCMYTHHFETAIKDCMKHNMHGDPLHELLMRLEKQTRSMKWGAEKTKAAIGRVRAYSLAYQMQVLASKIQSSDEFKVIAQALTKTVAGKAASAFDDPQKVHIVCGKVASSLNAGMMDIMKKPVAATDNQDEANQDSATGMNESYERAEEVLETKANIAMQAEPDEDEEILEGSAAHAELCLRALTDKATFREMEDEKRKTMMKNVFKSPQDVYRAYVMNASKIETTRAGTTFDPAEAFKGAMEMWDELTDAKRNTWEKRMKKIKPVPDASSDIDHADQTIHGTTEIKQEEPDGQTGTFTREVSIRLTPKPQSQTGGPASNPPMGSSTGIGGPGHREIVHPLPPRPTHSVGAKHRRGRR